MSAMGTPMSQLRGDLRAQDRFGVLVGVVGEPANDVEGALLGAARPSAQRRRDRNPHRAHHPHRRVSGRAACAG